MSIYRDILHAIENKERLLAVLIDPDKFSIGKTFGFIEKVNASVATHIFIGGSTVEANATDVLVRQIKKHTNLPVVLFPGDVTQISDNADALLFLSLISGRNPDYLIDKHVEAVSILKEACLEVISTGYMLIDGGTTTAVEKVTNTKPMPRNDINKIINTACAGQLLGMKLIYLEAGSGAKAPLTIEVISQVKSEMKVPLIVGGGIKTKEQLESAYKAGADFVVIGTAFEEDELFFDRLKK